MCSYPPLFLIQSRQASDAILAQNFLDSELEGHLILRVIELVLFPDGRRNCLGNWHSTKLELLSMALVPKNSSSAVIDVVLTTTAWQPH